MPTDEIVEPCPDDTPHRCRRCGQLFPERRYRECFSDGSREHRIVDKTGAMVGESESEARTRKDSRRVPAVPSPAAEVAQVQESDEEDEEPIVAEPTRVYPEAKNPELSEHDRYVRFVLGPVRGPRK
ncbi:MAG: hypothetical protein WAN72_11770 [Candidatus Acidiferrales bacterium]